MKFLCNVVSMKKTKACFGVCDRQKKKLFTCGRAATERGSISLEMRSKVHHQETPQRHGD